MMCAWKELLSILPHRIRGNVDRLGKDGLQELRLRINAPPELIFGEKRVWLAEEVRSEDLSFVINAASRYSPWSASSSAKGYLTVIGGHRIGICGEVTYHNGAVTGIREVHSLCIRVARDFYGMFGTEQLPQGSVLILGAPGWGKTTLLRELVRQISEVQTVAVVDERRELFPEGFRRGKKMDVLIGCPKTTGIEMLLRTMGPECIAVDEITAEEDCCALLQAANCGVRLLATAHAASLADFTRRSAYRLLVEEKAIDTIVILRRDKSHITERMTV